MHSKQRRVRIRGVDMGKITGAREYLTLPSNVRDGENCCPEDKV